MVESSKIGWWLCLLKNWDKSQKKIMGMKINKDKKKHYFKNREKKC